MYMPEVINSPTSTYRKLEIVGEGSFGVVAKCEGKDGLTAVKMLKSPSTEDQREEEEILRMLSRSQQRKHFVCFLESFLFNDYHFQVFEYVEMSLQQFIEERTRIPILETGPLLLQLLLALRQLEELQIIHADLKPENIMVNRQGNLKVIDFGASHFVKKAMVIPCICTRWYRAPEIIVGVKYNTAMDMWSFGCIAAEMLTGRVLYKGSDELGMLGMMSYNHYFPGRFLDAGLKTRYFFEKINGTWKLKDTIKNGNEMIHRPPGILFKNFQSIPCKKSDFSQRKNLGCLIMKVLEVEPGRRPSASMALEFDFFKNGYMEQSINYWESTRRTGPRTPEGTPPPPSPDHSRSRSPIILSV